MRAYECDLTGELLKGEASRSVVVQTDDLTRFTVVVERRADKNAVWRTGHMSPSAVALVQEAAKNVALKARGKK